MKKNIIKIIAITIMFILSCYCMQTYVYADWVTDAEEFSNGTIVGETPAVTFNKTNLENTSNFISGILLGISVIVAVITTAILGLSFIVESAEGKAKVKEALVPLIVGMVISFGAFVIWKFAISLLFT